MIRSFIIILLLILIGISTVGIGKDSFQSRRAGPKIFLWAWERPEDLTFIDTKTTGIAFLAGTIRIKDNNTVIINARRQPLLVSDHTLLVAVVRIEPDRVSHNRLSSALKSDVRAAIIQLYESFKVSQVQIDFDARASERTFYRELLEDLRKHVPNDVVLNITALASWCTHDTWVNSLPVDEIVPMLFRMGPEGRQIVQYLERHGDFREPMCRSSVGISTDEPFIKIPPGKRVYIFSPTKWTKSKVENVFKEAVRWQ